MFPDNQLINIVRPINVLPNFLPTTSETMGDYYLKAWYRGVASQYAQLLKTSDLRKLGKMTKVSKLHRI